MSPDISRPASATENPEEWGLTVSDELPDWADQSPELSM